MIKGSDSSERKMAQARKTHANSQTRPGALDLTDLVDSKDEEGGTTEGSVLRLLQDSGGTVKKKAHTRWLSNYSSTRADPVDLTNPANSDDDTESMTGNVERTLSPTEEPPEAEEGLPVNEDEWEDKDIHKNSEESSLLPPEPNRVSVSTRDLGMEAFGAA